jgi:hypothetical protein
MKLIELDPSWWSNGGPGLTDTATGLPVPERTGQGITFDCPCGCADIVSVPFTNPLDGGPPARQDVTWDRTGETFETLTLSPSLQRMDGCKWHGWVRNGEVITC